MNLYTRQFIAAFLVFAGSLNLWSQPLADGNEKFLGCAWSTTQNLNFSIYWNQVTPENGGKWGSVESNRNIMNWTAMDGAYNLAKTKGFLFKNHTMIWGSQQPSWIENLDTAQQRQEIEQWFSLTASRYPGMDFIDVVNEPLHAPPSGAGHGNYINALGGTGISGWDWVITSFRMARKYFPNSKLLINEYNIVNSRTNTLQYIEIINLLKADSLIDGIGVQAHAFSTYGVDAGVIKSNLDLLASTDLPVYASELDIDGSSDFQQVKEYMRVFPVFWEHPGVAGITLWGFRYGLWRNTQGAYLVTQSGVERPAFNWLKAYVNDTLILSQSITVASSDDTDTIYLDQTLQMSASVAPSNATLKNNSWMLFPSGLATISASGLLTPLSSGKVSVRAITWDTGKIGSKDIVIISRPVETISVTSEGDRDTIALQETLQLQADVLPENAADRSVNWSTLPEGIAEINQAGMLTPLTAGTVTAVARANDGSGVTDSMRITIVDPTGTKRITGGNISIYPNPSPDGIFKISGLENISEVSVSDLQGRIIEKKRLNQLGFLELNLSGYRGIYIVRFSNQEHYFLRKVVIE